MPLIKANLKNDILSIFDAVDDGTTYESAAETIGEAIISYSNPIIYAVNGKSPMDQSFKANLATSAIPSAPNGKFMLMFADWLAAYTAQFPAGMVAAGATAATPPAGLAALKITLLTIWGTPVIPIPNSRQAFATKFSNAVDVYMRTGTYTIGTVVSPWS